MRIAHTRGAPWPRVHPQRFASRVQSDTPEGCRIALLGLPDDTGVRLNRGRAGASEGPRAFRAALAAFGTTWDGLRRRELEASVFDAGDVEPAAGEDEGALFETHRRVEAAAAELHRLGLVVTAIGGGHDLSLPAITALSKHLGAPIGGVSLDAHLDVRQSVGSGMPFRRLVEGHYLDARRFAVLGVGRFANERADCEWLTERGGTLVPLSDVISGNASPSGVLVDVVGDAPGFASIDLDGLDGAHAPGVSAVSPWGLGLQHASELAEAAGRLANISHFDLMELCPAHDVDGRTARAAAYLFLSFVAGFAERPR